MKMKKKTQEKTKFSEKWSPHLEKYGFTPISNIFLRFYPYLNLTTQEALFIIHCFRYKWTANHPYPSFNTIAEEMGKSRNAVQGYARSLERKGIIKRITQIGRQNKIDFSDLIEMLERLAPYQNSNKGDIKKFIKVYLNIDT